MAAPGTRVSFCTSYFSGFVCVLTTNTYPDNPVNPKSCPQARTHPRTHLRGEGEREKERKKLNNITKSKLYITKWTLLWMRFFSCHYLSLLTHLPHCCHNGLFKGVPDTSGSGPKLLNMACVRHTRKKPAFPTLTPRCLTLIQRLVKKIWWNIMPAIIVFYMANGFLQMWLRLLINWCWINQGKD